MLNYYGNEGNLKIASLQFTTKKKKGSGKKFKEVDSCKIEIL